ncbi:MAG: Gfo/Idh/MocA family oxidoreductase [Bryobacteraceae bacterium]|nr:Gfo/Idh/MocA family oxidoreductase [Bryobacteraceae bacterium]
MERRDFLAGMAAFAANDTVQIGCIGTGGRAQVLMRNLESVRGARITAVCDVWDVNLEKARQIAGPGAFASKDYRAVLDRKDVDAVLIGAPDHQHVPLTIAACNAGKDVYVEKPLTHDLAEGRAVIDAQNRNRRIVLVGMQQRSMPHIQRAYEIVKSGRIGQIHKVHLTWNRNQPRWERPNYNIDAHSVDWKTWLGGARPQAFDEYRFRQWRWFWDFGGGIFTDLMVHWIDVAHWFLDVDHPSEAHSIGDMLKAKGLWETPDTVQTILRYPERQAQVYFEGTFVNARNAAMIEFMGTEGTLYIDRGRYEVHPELRSSRLEYAQWILGDGPRGADFYTNPNGELLHLQHWVDCIRTRKTPNAPAEAGVSAASAAHMANKALRTRQTALWAG